MTRIAFMSLLLFLTASIAPAQNKPPTPQANPKAASRGMPCMPYFKQFCSAVVPGQGRMLDCLDKHKPQLAPACRDKLDWADRIRAKQHLYQQKPGTASTQSGAKTPTPPK